jgi:hypothetical protein
MFSFVMPLLSCLGPLWHAICPNKISSVLSTARSSKPGRTNLRNLSRFVIMTNFAPIWSTVMPIMHGQELGMGLVYISFPITWVKYVPSSSAGKFSDRLFSFGFQWF